MTRVRILQRGPCKAIALLLSLSLSLSLSKSSFDMIGLPLLKAIWASRKRCSSPERTATLLPLQTSSSLRRSNSSSVMEGIPS